MPWSSDETQGSRKAKVSVKGVPIRHRMELPALFRLLVQVHKMYLQINTFIIIIISLSFLLYLLVIYLLLVVLFYVINFKKVKN